MKILLIKSFPLLSSVGILARELKKRGHDVHVLIPRRHPENGKWKNSGFPLHVLDFVDARFQGSSPLKMSYLHLRAVWKLFRFLKKNRFDIIHLNLWQARLYGRIASLFTRKTRVVSTIHGCESFYEKSTNRIDDGTIAVSHFTKWYLVSRGLPEGKITVIPNGVSVPKGFETAGNGSYLHRELGLPETTKIIGMLAYLNRTGFKGHDIFLEAARLVLEKRGDIRFVLVGTDIENSGAGRKFGQTDRERELVTLARTLEIRDKVDFLGERFDTDEISASLFAHVLPSSTEGCSMVLLETMAHGIPNVATNIAANAEIIRDRESGLLFEPNRPDLLARSLLSLIDNPEAAKRMGEQGRKRVETHFEAGLMATKYEDLFIRLLKNG